MAKPKSISTPHTSEPFNPQKIQRKDFLGLLSRVSKTVGDDKSRVDAYKCFRFEPDTVASFDGTNGILAASPLNLTCSVYASRVLAYLKALDTETVDIGMHDKKLRINDVHFPVLGDNDFPDLAGFLGSDAKPLCGQGLGEALKDILFCIDKSTERNGLPPAVQFYDGAIYASDSTHAAVYFKASLNLDKTTQALLHIDACKTLVALGEPEEVQITDRSLLAFYDGGALCFAAGLLERGPSIAKAIDAKIATMQENAKVTATIPPLLPALKRLKALAGKDSVRVVWNDVLSHWVLSVENKAEGIQGEEIVPDKQPIPGFICRVGIEPLMEALAAEPDFMDVSDVVTLRPSCLRFSHMNWEHLVALRSQ
jgi:hypothetical protein